jgi:hypothetical protein
VPVIETGARVSLMREGTGLGLSTVFGIAQQEPRLRRGPERAAARASLARMVPAKPEFVDDSSDDLGRDGRER